MEELRIGIFVCRCGTNIGGFLDVPALKDYAGTLPNVVFAEENLFSCSEAGVTAIKNAIQEQGLSRVVVAACTPRTHEPVFRAACEEAGLNPFLFEFVNIREHCSWVHRAEGERATDKAKDLIRMGAARAALLAPLERIRAEVKRSALVVGAGISGLTAALTLGERGFEVTLVEREEEPGGMLRRLFMLGPVGPSAAQLLEERVGAVTRQPKVELLTRMEIAEVRGYIGNYQVKLRHVDGRPSSGEVGEAAQEITRQVGVIIVATGATSLGGEGLFGYDGDRVITQLELEGLLREGRSMPASVAMIQCAGSRVRERIYCSRICCLTAVKNSILIMDRSPQSRVHILYRDLGLTGTEGERALRRAKELGVRFVHYALTAPPEIDDGKVRLRSEILGRTLDIPAELVVLSTPLVPREGAGPISRALKVPLDEDRFFLEAHVKLRPVEFATDGIYVCGTAHWPAASLESMVQALGAASRASIHLTRGSVEVEPIVSSLADEEGCRGCGLCADLCPYGAIEIAETEKGPKARMIEVACKGCGVCASTCYRRAIRMNHFSDEQLRAQMRAFLE